MWCRSCPTSKLLAIVLASGLLGLYVAALTTSASTATTVAALNLSTDWFFVTHWVMHYSEVFQLTTTPARTRLLHGVHGTASGVLGLVSVVTTLPSQYHNPINVWAAISLSGAVTASLVFSLYHALACWNRRSLPTNSSRV